MCTETPGRCSSRVARFPPPLWDHKCHVLLHPQPPPKRIRSDWIEETRTVTKRGDDETARAATLVGGRWPDGESKHTRLSSRSNNL